MTDIPVLMNAVALNRFGGVDELEYQVVRMPEIDDDEILVRGHGPEGAPRRAGRL